MTDVIDFGELEPHVNGAPELEIEYSGGAGAPFAPDLELNEEDPGTATRDERERGAPAVHWHSLALPAPLEWYETAPPPREWLLRDSRTDKARGVFPLGKVGQLIAEGGAGKTLALCQLAVAVATGTPWIGVFSVPAPGRVLLVLGEEDAEEARRRLYHASRASNAPRPAADAIVVLPLAGLSAPMLELDAAGNVVEAPFLPWVRDYANAGAFRLVAIDPLSRFGGPDVETDNAAATRFIQALESLAASDRGVLNAHHTNKVARGRNGIVDATAGRGSSGLVDGARWQCALTVERLELEGAEERERLGEVVTFAVNKSNYAAKPEPVVLRRDLGNGGALVPLDDTDRAMLDDARRATDPSAARRTVREADRQARKEQQAAEDEAKAAKRATDETERIEREDAAAAAILASHGGRITCRAWYAEMRACLGSCSNGRADAARARVGR